MGRRRTPNKSGQLWQLRKRTWLPRYVSCLRNLTVHLDFYLLILLYTSIAGPRRSAAVGSGQRRSYGGCEPPGGCEGAAKRSFHRCRRQQRKSLTPSGPAAGAGAAERGGGRPPGEGRPPPLGGRRACYQAARSRGWQQKAQTPPSSVVEGGNQYSRAHWLCTWTELLLCNVRTYPLWLWLPGPDPGSGPSIF